VEPAVTTIVVGFQHSAAAAHARGREASYSMAVADRNIIDIVAKSHAGEALLVMVEDREWGSKGELLEDLQAKLYTYLAFAEDQLGAEYPQLVGLPLHIQLRTEHAPGVRELEFLRLANERVLAPGGIRLSWQLLRAPRYGA
jgi:hypothetical protein